MSSRITKCRNERGFHSLARHSHWCNPHVYHLLATSNEHAARFIALLVALLPFPIIPKKEVAVVSYWFSSIRGHLVHIQVISSSDNASNVIFQQPKVTNVDKAILIWRQNYIPTSILYVPWPTPLWMFPPKSWSMIPLRTFVLPHQASSRICTLSSKILPTYCSLPLSAASLHSLHLLVAVSSMSKIVERVARPCMTLNLVAGAAIGWGGGTMKKKENGLWWRERIQEWREE